MSRFIGKFRGLVVSNVDEQHLGRLKVRVPSVLGNLSVWARPCVPFAGEKVGFYSLPKVGDGIWVEFEAGDPSCAVWTGGWWANDELPHQNGPNERVWQTDSFVIRLTEPPDEDGKPRLDIHVIEEAIVTLEGNEIHMDGGGSKVDVTSDTVTAEAHAGSKIELGNTAKINGTGLEVKRG